MQVGAYPYLVHTIFKGQSNLPPEALGTSPAEIENGRREWGMRAVHEIVRGGPSLWELPEGTLEKSLYAFGYGAPDVDVWTYWADQPAFRINNDQVKGLLLTRKSDRKMFLVLQSWSKTPVKASVTFQPKQIGFAPGKFVESALGGNHGKWNGGTLEMELPFPYETGIYLIDPQPRPDDLLFADDFNRSFNPGWDHLNNYIQVKDGAVRFSKNTALYQGAPRLLKWQSLPDFEQGELSFSFQIEKLPAGRAEVVTAELGKGISWGDEGVGRGKLIGQIKAELLADADKGWVCRVSGNADGNYQSLGEVAYGTPDTAPHKVQLGFMFHRKIPGKMTETFDCGEKPGRMGACQARKERSVGSLRGRNPRKGRPFTTSRYWDPRYLTFSPTVRSTSWTCGRFRRGRAGCGRRREPGRAVGR